MSHIFISYSKIDILFGRHLRGLLQDAGYTVWMDETKLVPSQKWWPTIEQNILDCAAFIVIMSSNSANSDWVEREILVAEEKDVRKPVVPVLLAGRGWRRLGNIEYVDMSAGMTIDSIPEKLLNGLVSINVPRHTGKAAPPPLPNEPTLPPPSQPLVKTQKGRYDEAIALIDADQYEAGLGILNALSGEGYHLKGGFVTLGEVIEDAQGKLNAAQRLTEMGERYDNLAGNLRYISNADRLQKAQTAWDNFNVDYPDFMDDTKGVAAKLAELDRKYPIPFTPAQERLITILTDYDKYPPEERLKAGDELAVIGDPRPGVGLKDGLPWIEWCKVEGGDFIMGSDKYDNDEKPERTLNLPTFYIARYPVTYAQFGAFLTAPDGYSAARWWGGLHAEATPHQEGGAGMQNWKIANRPRETVSWYDALAFTRWLSYKLRYEISLPSEEQWEKAARGTDGRQYPWGNGYREGFANIDETYKNAQQKIAEVGSHYLNETSAVGMYPNGESPYDALDMSGNVWEWCINNYEGNQIALNSNNSRVLHGGSWSTNSGDARGSLRYGYLPSGRFNLIGFRVVCLSVLPL